MSEKNLTFKINYYTAFQNVRSIMDELHILLTPNKKHKEIFPNVPSVGFWKGKGLKNYLVRAKLPKVKDSRRCKLCGTKTSLICDSITTTTTLTTESCQEAFKIQKDPSHCDSKKVLYLLKCEIYGEAPYESKK